ncbi:MAG: (2Fe-2S)-binding protein [Leptospiraceae bacterium]|nr:(2Fe-2S)-binding protein [Leptospiraceae bacterium]
MAKVTINDQEFEVTDGTNVLEACIANGIKLEHFCYHRYLPVDGNCRTCMVEIDTPRGPMLTVGCNTKVSDGMVVHTESEKAVAAQKSALEFLLLDHPLDCPICDKAGECKLQDHYMDFGQYDHRRIVPRFFKEGKAQDTGEHIVLDNERCILCTRCMRFLDNIPGTSELGIINRGHEARISTFPGKPIQNDYSGNITDVCPVGALTLKEFRFKQRVWFLKKADSICTGCARGCSITIEHNRGKIWRFMPRENAALNRVWMCDRGRFAFQSLQENRLFAASVNKSACSVDTALKAAKAVLAQTDANRLAAIASPWSSVETSYQLKLLGQANTSAFVPEPDGAADDILMLAARYPNENGLKLLGITTDCSPILDRVQQGEIDTLVVVENNLAIQSEWKSALTKVKNLIVLSSTADETAEMASICLPVRNYAETDGSFVNATSLLQRALAAIEPENSKLPAPAGLLTVLASFAGREVNPDVNIGNQFAAWSAAVAELQTVQWHDIPPEGLQLSLAPIADAPFKNKKIDFNTIPCKSKNGAAV